MFFEQSLDFFKFAVAFFHGKKGGKKRPREHCCVLGPRSFFSLRSINSTRREMCVNLHPALFYITLLTLKHIQLRCKNYSIISA